MKEKPRIRRVGRFWFAETETPCAFGIGTTPLFAFWEWQVDCIHERHLTYMKDAAKHVAREASCKRRSGGVVARWLAGLLGVKA